MAINQPHKKLISRESCGKLNGRHIIDPHQFKLISTQFKLISTQETHNKINVNGRHMII